MSCGNGGVLVLVQAVLNLRISPLYNTSLYLLHLCEAECVSYLDEVASNTRSQNLAKSIALQYS
ncbi:SOSS complex subunit B1 [Orobanche gracilis]